MVQTTNQRPRRQAAIAAHENVIMPLTAKGKASAKASAVTKRKMARSAAVVSDEELSSEDDENDDDLEDTTGGETDMDETSNFGDKPSKKRQKNGSGKIRRVQTGPARARAPAKRKGATGAVVSKASASRRVATSKNASAPRGKARKRVAGNKEELPINEDNKLFNHVKNPDADLAETAEEWAMYYHDNAGMALAQLVNFFIRSAGCNGTIDENQAEDHDAIASNLSDIQLAFKSEVMPSYPLVSRAPTFAKFRHSVSEFLQELFDSARETDMLFDDTFMETFLAWISAMSSSKFRSFRHTAVFVALQTVSQMSRIRQDVDGELQNSTRSLESEKKKARNDKARLKELDSKVKSIKEAMKNLQEYHSELINTVFVHRYRDSDAGIRVECVDALGSWLKTYPHLQREKIFLQSIGTLLPDIDASVRMAALKAINGMLGRAAPPQHIRHFLQIQKKRLIDLALLDIDMSVRIAAMNVILQLDRHELLEDEEREGLASHIFNVEEKMRAAVTGFFSRTLDEEMGEEAEEEALDNKVRLKSFAALLVRLSERIDGASGSDLDSTSLQQNKGDNLEALRAYLESRITLVVGSLWETIAELHDWRAMLDLLLYDHSNTGAATSAKGKRTGATAPSSGENLPPSENLRLTSEQEALLVETLIAVARRVHLLATTATNLSTKDEQDEEAIKALSDMTRALIHALPKLFAKYRTDAPRITNILLLPLSMHIDIYVETQQASAYEALWDDIADQFRRHVEPTLLSNAVDALMALSQADAFSDIYTAKLGELQEKLIGSLRESVEGRDIESTGFVDDELHKLTSYAMRAKFVSQRTDMCEALEEDDEERQTSGWDVLLGLASRGRLGLDEESSMVENSLAMLSLYILWKTRSLIKTTVGPSNKAVVDTLVKRRDALLHLAADLMDVKASTAVCNEVQRESFAHTLDIVTLHCSAPTEDENAEITVDEAAGGRVAMPKMPSGLHLLCSRELQTRYADFISEEIRRYADTFLRRKSQDKSALSRSNFEDGDVSASARRSEEDDDDDDASAAVTDTVDEQGAAGRPSQSFLERFNAFTEQVSSFVRAIKLGVIDVRHCVEILAFYGRLGPSFDACAKLVIDTLREDGILYQRGAETCSIMLQVLQRALQIHYDYGKTATSETIFVNLSKALSSAFVIRGAQLTIQKAIKAEPMVQLHSNVIAIALSSNERASSASSGRGSASSTPAPRAKDAHENPLLLFKAIAQLLVSAGPREAMRIKAGLDKRAREHPATVERDNGSLKAYEKRLVTIISKDKGLAAGAAGAKALEKDRASSMDLMDVDEPEEINADEARRAVRGRPKPIPITASRKRARDDGEEEENEHNEDEDEAFEGLDISISRDQEIGSNEDEEEEEEEDDDAEDESSLSDDDESVALSQMPGRIKRAPL